MKRTPLQRGNSNNITGRVSLKRSKGLRVKSKTEQQIQQSKEDKEKMWSVFMEIWSERPHRSEVSTVSLGYECKSVYMHHIWPKSRYPELKYVKENIIQLTAEEHQIVENDPLRYPEVNKRREELKQKYNL